TVGGERRPHARCAAGRRGGCEARRGRHRRRRTAGPDRYRTHPVMSATDLAQEDRAAQAAQPILCVVGARPNYMKMAPIIRALAAHGALPPVLVHTGQHYDAAMNDAFFTALKMPRPAVNLEVGSASHAVQTAEIM